MKYIVFLSIWLNDIALVLGMFFATDFTQYKYWVFCIICVDIIGTICLGLFKQKKVTKIIVSVNKKEANKCPKKQS